MTGTAESLFQVSNSSGCKKDGESKHCFRGYERICGPDGHSIPFYEFLWGYFLNDAVTKESLWPSSVLYSQFQELFQDIDEPEDYGKIDTDLYADLAVLMAQLCHGEQAQSYSLPSIFQRSSLPGWFPAGTAKGPDPDCDPPSCPTSEM